ncbi:MAG: hypothetical protein KIS61_00375 [Candidatus Eremiobacteraeota bacterium]|nr:hypothetical protein [Candidatus Eremiobacteraeota bacterium]
MSLQPVTFTTPKPRQSPPRAVSSAPVEFSYNPQDQLVMSPGTLKLSGLGADLSSEKVALKEPLEPVNGKFVYEPSDPRFHAANAFAAVNRTLDVFSEAYGQPIQWATGRDKLSITPNNGNDFNAYYSRDDGGLFFFEGIDPKTKKSTFSADSGEVVGHEAGHAILDAIRPGYFSAWSLDPGAFHESFGDVLAMLTSLKDDRVLAKVVEQTGGDLRRQNSVAALGEELGVAINSAVGKNVTGGDYTRNAINQFTWKDPSKLPSSAPPDQLARQVHSFSRLWTGAFYDVFTGMVQEKLDQGLQPAAALSSAADEGLKMYARMMKASPEGDFTFKDMANALLKSENEGNQGKYSALIENRFSGRGILPQSNFADDEHETTGPGTRLYSTSLDGPQFGMFQGAKVESLLSGSGQAGLRADEGPALRLKERMQELIAEGEIKYTEPNQAISAKDLFRPDGRPYTGVVRWLDGQMQIERVRIAH